MIYIYYTGYGATASTSALGALNLSSNLSTPTRSYFVDMRVSYIGITLAFQANERSSTLLTRSFFKISKNERGSP